MRSTKFMIQLALPLGARTQMRNTNFLSNGMEQRIRDVQSIMKIVLNGGVLHLWMKIETM